MYMFASELSHYNSGINLFSRDNRIAGCAVKPGVDCRYLIFKSLV